MGHGGVDRADGGLALPRVPTGNRFLIRSRLFTDDEYAALGQESSARKVGIQTAPLKTAGQLRQAPCPRRRRN
jgi:hypothetical protein